jgi:hypothetical protein
MFRHAQMIGPDKRMDQREPFAMPANPLSRKCPRCTFPDIDFVPQPYFLVKGVGNPKEMAPAEIGNFLVRSRARQILEAVAPDQCRFYPTHDLKTKEETGWFLAVPTTLIRTATIKSTVPRCPECGEAQVAHPGSHYQNAPGERPVAAIPQDVFKSLNWSSYETIGEESPWYYKNILGWTTKQPVPPFQWTRITLGRELYFSIRLRALLKKLGIKGLSVCSGQDDRPNREELAWVDEMHRGLA